jgi:hypothetical protein
MWGIRTSIALIVLCSAVAFAQEDSWDKVRYSGGSLQTSVDPKDWGNHLEVTSEKITFGLKDGQGIVVLAKDVTALSYGQEANRRIGKLGVLVAPVGLVKLLHKSRLHFIGMEYTIHGQKGALLLQGDKDNYEAILRALIKSTDAPVSVSEKDRTFVPNTAKTVIVKEPEEEVTKAKK